MMVLEQQPLPEMVIKCSKLHKHFEELPSSLWRICALKSRKGYFGSGKPLIDSVSSVKSTAQISISPVAMSVGSSSKSLLDGK
jgi:hypothetical protein